MLEKTSFKPFNPLLGETYEFVNDDMEYLAEQVSHHPPITACYCRGRKSRYVIQTNLQFDAAFNGKNLKIKQDYRCFIDL